MKKDTILLKQCHKEYTDKFLACRDIYKTNPNDKQTYNLMAKWSCLVDLIVRLHNSVVAEEKRRQKYGDNGKDQNGKKG